MIRPGVVSVTFRQLSADQIVDLAAQAQLAGIEWGGDVHVPHGNLRIAEEVGHRTEARGLVNASYGSYYRMGMSPQQGLAFETVLQTAVALGTRNIRVWAGGCASQDADETTWQAVISDAQRIADMARGQGISIGVEHHAGTLADGAEQALRLHRGVDRANFRLYWQPLVGLTEEERRDSIRLLGEHISNVHVFQWTPGATGEVVRRPLESGAAEWRSYLALLPPAERWCFLEFVSDDGPGNLLADARALRQWL